MNANLGVPPPQADSIPAGLRVAGSDYLDVVAGDFGGTHAASMGQHAATTYLSKQSYKPLISFLEGWNAKKAAIFTLGILTIDATLNDCSVPRAAISLFY